MTTIIIEVTGTDISPFNKYNSSNVLHCGYLKDAFAAPLSFFYSSTANGGIISTTYSKTISGGEFNVSYNDLKENDTLIDGRLIFCDTEVVFDFSNFDETKAKIIKLIFYPKNGESIRTYNSFVLNNQISYPVLSSINASYYPSDNFYTFFNPHFKIYYSDGNIVNVTIPLTSVQCGIFESFKDKTIVDAIPFYRNTDNILTFINDTSDDNLIISNISTQYQFQLESEKTQLPYTILAPFALPFGSTSFNEIVTKPIDLPKPPVTNNPVLPDKNIESIITFDNKQIDSFSNIDIYKFN
jgi:hypothetical protein